MMMAYLGRMAGKTGKGETKPLRKANASLRFIKWTSEVLIVVFLILQ